MTAMPEPDRFVVLPDGRRLAFDDRGDGEGTPVLFFHGTPDTRLARHPDDSIAAGLGFRVLAADRPGLGGSDPDPEADPASVAADHTALLDHLGIDVAHVVTWSAGSIHGLSLAGAHPERVQSLTLVAPLIPADAYDTPGVLDGSDDSRRLFAEHLGTTSPGDLGRELAMWLVPPVIDDGLARTLLESTIEQVAGVVGAGDAMVAALQGSVAQGMLGLEREIAGQASPLGSVLDAIDGPVTIHVGEHDRTTPPAMARWFRDRLDGRLTMHGGGHLIALTHWAEILGGIPIGVTEN